MEFWGVEVKPRQSVKCVAGDDKILHLSQASLGEIRKDKGSETVPLFVKVNDQKLVLGTLSAENCAQIHYDLVFEKEFELSHGSKDTSVFFVGYKSSMQESGFDDDYSDSDSDEGLQIEHQLDEKDLKNYQKAIAGKVTSVKDNSASAKFKPQTGKADKAEKSSSLKNVKDEDEDEDDDEDEDEDEDDNEDDSEDESDDDEEMPKGLISSNDDDEDDDSSEDEKAKTIAENGKKRFSDGSSKPSADKRAKLTTAVKQNPDVKKGSKAIVTPTAKQAGKSSASCGKAKEQSSKSTGSLKCNSCSKPFNSENALLAHTKAKHSTSK